jgi:signal transduction histidine kinase
MMKFDRSVSQVRIIYILTTIFLVGLSLFTFTKVKDLFAFTELMSRSYDVKASTSAITESLLGAAYHKRGFLLSGDALMEMQEEKAIAALHKELEDLDRMIRDHPDQMKNLERLGKIIERKLAKNDQMTQEMVSPPLDSAINRFIHSQALLMDSIHLQLEGINKIERHMFEKRAQLFSRLSIMAPIYIIVLFLGALLILFYSYFRLTRQLESSQRLHSALVIQNKDRGALAKELLVVNEELAFQNEEKEKRANELTVANVELAYQNKEKEDRAAELSVANQELAFQNAEKEKQTIALYHANKELELFLNISSHDLQEPLRKIQMAASRIDDQDINALSLKGRDYFHQMQEAAQSMQALIEDLLVYSRTKSDESDFEKLDLTQIIEEVKTELREDIEEKKAVIEVTESCEVMIIRFQFRQLMNNLLCNALKFSTPGKPPLIQITCKVKKGIECLQEGLVPQLDYGHITISDNGIGFDPIYNKKIFEVFQRLHGKEVYGGSGMGLAIVKKIVENHHGVITANGEVNKGATFDIYIPMKMNTQNG